MGTGASARKTGCIHVAIFFSLSNELFCFFLYSTSMDGVVCEVFRCCIRLVHPNLRRVRSGWGWVACDLMQFNSGAVTVFQPRGRGYEISSVWCNHCSSSPPLLYWCF